MYKTFNYTHQFTMEEIEQFGDDRVKKIQEIMLDGLIHAMNQDDDLFDTESVYDPESNTVSVRFGIHGIQSGYQANQILPKQKPPVYRSIYQEVKAILFATREDAETTRTALIDIYEKYGFVTKADFYDLVGIASQFTDQKYGWKNLNGMLVRRSLENSSKYELILPKPIELN